MAFAAQARLECGRAFARAHRRRPRRPSPTREMSSHFPTSRRLTKRPDSVPTAARRCRRARPSVTAATRPTGCCNVAANKLVGTSPMVLPDGCVSCGVPTPEGPRTRKKLYYYPVWIWLGAYRRGHRVRGALLHIPQAARRELLRCATSAPPAWASRRASPSRPGCCLLAAVALGVITGATWALIAIVVLLLMALGASVMVGPPLRVAGYDERYFSVAGACPEFLTHVGETVH